MSETEIIRELTSRWVTREELCAMLGVPDGVARAYIRDLNERLAECHSCILSTAARKGYHIPNPRCEEDVRLVIHADTELKNKAISIFERRRVLADFVKYAETLETQPELIQGTLF